MTLTVLSAGALSVLTIFAAQSDRQPADADQAAVVQLRLEAARKETVASAILVHREETPENTVLYFLTSERLLTNASVAPSPLVPDSEGEGEDGATMADIAVLRILAANSPLVPARITLDPPRLGASFSIVSYDAAGARVVVQQRVGMMSERFAVGDIELQTPTCMGAPALSEKGVFGIVTRCDANRPPIVTLLSAAKDLLQRLIPTLNLTSWRRAPS